MIADYNGEEVENGLLRFTADWCAPCRVYGPQFDKVTARLDTQCYVVDIEEYPGVAQRYGIMSIPAVVHVKDGEGTKFPKPPTPEEIVNLVD